MSTGKILLLCAAALLAMVLLCLAAIWFEKRASGETYDERQRQNRGSAYCTAFWTGAVYFLVYCTWLLEGEAQGWVPEPFLAVYIGLILQFMVFQIHCLLTKSALPLSEKPVLTMVSYGLLAARSLMDFFLFQDNPYITDSMRAVKLINGVCFCTLLVMHLIGWLWKKKTREKTMS